MAQDKKALLCVFKPEHLKSTDQMREWFSGSYERFLDMDGVEFKCWWVDQERGEWGAFYVFRSAQELQAYITSDTWLKVVPEKYGCVPTWRILEPALIISKDVVTQMAGSWQSA
jgi:hypothetical protein